MPIHNSGCRYFGRLTAVLGMTPCYLRTYTHLLQQHRYLLRLADALMELPAGGHFGGALPCEDLRAGGRRALGCRVAECRQACGQGGRRDLEHRADGAVEAGAELYSDHGGVVN